MMTKMYVLVRKDLTRSQQAVQAGHALAEYLVKIPDTQWRNGTLIYLGVKGLRQLENWKLKLKRMEIEFAEFNEPDIGNETTALAIVSNENLFRNLNLL